jgi:UDP-N-acetylglucosamine--N-acetylmuramyl-(pentapeptide) pyrophosphoryl-undecaprenol N-acetylglucosamine transferase
MSKKIVFTAGGTGGHILPAINLMKHFFDKKYQVLLVTDKRGAVFIKNSKDFKLHILNLQIPTNKNLLKKFFSYLIILYSTFKSFFILRKEKPDLIFGFGGYVSFPISLASIFLKIPLITYENNMVLGRANKYLLPFSKKVLIAEKNPENLPEKYKNKAFKVGSLLNKKIINHTILKQNDKNIFSILVLGGSQGAEIFGHTVPVVMKMLKERGYNIQINQQCLAHQRKFLVDFYTKNKIKNNIFEFEDNIINLILSTSLAISRCGASTTAELSYTNTPFIGIPLPNSVDNHQLLNAKYYENMGCCWLLEQANFNADSLFNLVIEIIKNKNKLESIRNNVKKDYNKNAYINIENEVKEFI